MSSGTETATLSGRGVIPRRFRLLDAMILIAATGVGCAVSIGMSDLSEDGLSWHTFLEELDRFVEVSSNPGETRAVMALGLVYLSILLLSPFVAIWGFALIPIRMIRPRPRWRRLARQPGFLAVCVTAAVICVFVTVAVICLMTAGWLFGNGAGLGGLGPDWLIMICSMFPGVAVLGAWLSLILGGRWRPEPNWIDRLGRAFGVFWILGGTISLGSMLLVFL